MSFSRDGTLTAILTSIDRSPLPDERKQPLRQALSDLFEDRPNAVDKVQAPLGRALRNPMFPDIWRKCVSDIPATPAYEPLRQAATGIAEFVDAHAAT